MAKNSFIHDMLVKMDSRLDDMAETLVRHDENLKTHMSRSLKNEEAVESLKSEITELQKSRQFWTVLKQLGGYILAFAAFCYYVSRTFWP